MRNNRRRKALEKAERSYSQAHPEVDLDEVRNRADWRDDPRSFSDYGDPEQDDRDDVTDTRTQDQVDQDERFARLVGQDDDRRTPRRTLSDRWKDWRNQSKTNPGVEPPEQTKDRVARHKAAEAEKIARIDAQVEGRVQDRFDDRTRPNVGRNGADSRRLNRRFLPDDIESTRASPGFDFTNETTDGGPFTRGRPVGQRSRSADYAWRMLDGFRF